jgi:hypothetical protein
MEFYNLKYLSKIYDYQNSNKNSNYYNRVYLCVDKNKSDDIILKGFNCYRFNNYQEADFYYYNKINKNNDSTVAKRSSIIPICKWVPFFFDPYIVSYKLKKQFWLGNHSFYTSSRHKMNNNE